MTFRLPPGILVGIQPTPLYSSWDRALRSARGEIDLAVQAGVLTGLVVAYTPPGLTVYGVRDFAAIHYGSLLLEVKVLFQEPDELDRATTSRLELAVANFKGEARLRVKGERHRNLDAVRSFEYV